MKEYFTWESFGSNAPHTDEGENILLQLNGMARQLDHEPTQAELNEIWEDFWHDYDTPTVLLEGYTIHTNKPVRVELDHHTGYIWVVYTATGYRRRYNQEYYGDCSDFRFLHNDFREVR